MWMRGVLSAARLVLSKMSTVVCIFASGAMRTLLSAIGKDSLERCAAGME